MKAVKIPRDERAKLKPVKTNFLEYLFLTDINNGIKISDRFQIR